jgi:hypothetical protein
MNAVESRVRAMINPMSTALTRWWCHSAMRSALTGHGRPRGRPLPREGRAARSAERGDALATARQRADTMTRQMKDRAGAAERAEGKAEQMRARAGAIDDLMASRFNDEIGGGT